MPGGFVEITAVARVRYVHDAELPRGQRRATRGRGKRTVDIAVKDYVEIQDRFIEVMLTKRLSRPSKRRLRRARWRLLKDAKAEMRRQLEARGEVWEDVAMTGVWGTEVERAEVQRKKRKVSKVVDSRSATRRRASRPEETRRKRGGAAAMNMTVCARCGHQFHDVGPCYGCRRGGECCR